jgi:glucokinase
MRLVGDIGGTKALLALADEEAGAPGLQLLASKRYVCADYADFTQLLTDYLSSLDFPRSEIVDACLAVAGPVSDDGCSAKLTNLPWLIDAGHLSTALGLGHVALVNDFVAAARGIAAVGSSELFVLQQGQPLEAGLRLVIGAGTGLGMALLIPEPGGWCVIPGEGGHVGFAPADRHQAAFWSHLHAIHGRVEYEHLVSGPGLVAAYRFEAGADADQRILAAADPAAAIASEAVQHPASACRRAVDLFLSAYGAFAGDMALALLPRGGIFLAGGIAAKMLPLMLSGIFLSAFSAKAGHSPLNARVPISVVTDPHLGLWGAALNPR